MNYMKSKIYTQLTLKVLHIKSRNKRLGGRMHKEGSQSLKMYPVKPSTTEESGTRVRFWKEDLKLSGRNQRHMPSYRIQWSMALNKHEEL